MSVVKTTRLNIRKLCMDDAAFMCALLNDSEWRRFIRDQGKRTIEDAANYIKNSAMQSYQDLGFGLFLVELKTAVPVGICGFVKRDYLPDVDIGFAFLPQFRKKGYAVEAASVLLSYAQQHLGMSRVAAITQKENLASIKVLEKIGLTFEKQIVCDAGQQLQLYSINFKKLDT
ncbi:GNAT family N-acetyltransferase [Candidatus Uabimicrobium amorphum]|uniref:Alanine acetyltransferase n=1 Tax=Uabimicrobium amorphum TaxID=2596890 RepID=A0A5S9F0W2_UABAM|nr:GNAT family N-acetyltransferase [Candidatus Uabimicrobium amorphum]BBM81997.1 alanine acetyltransferase [Candidatus Uabimicrobium amorphum]